MSKKPRVISQQIPDPEDLKFPRRHYAYRSSDVTVLFESRDTEACQRWCLSKLLKEDRLQEAIKELIADSGRSRRATRRWLYGEVMPQRGDWIVWQYWLRDQGCLTHELDKMPESYFQLRKHIWTNNISFKDAARQLKVTQTALWALLNNEVPWWNNPEERAWVVSKVGSVHRLVAEINQRITEREVLDMFEVDLDLDGDFSEVNQRYKLVSESSEEKKSRQAKQRKRLAQQAKQCKRLAQHRARKKASK